MFFKQRALPTVAVMVVVLKVMATAMAIVWLVIGAQLVHSVSWNYVVYCPSVATNEYRYVLMYGKNYSLLCQNGMFFAEEEACIDLNLELITGK